MTTFSQLFSFSRKEVALAFSTGKTLCRGKYLKIIKASTSFTDSYGKLLIITSRKIGKAHDRNLLRRRVKEIFYQKKLYKHSTGLHVLFTYPGATTLSFTELESFLMQCFSGPSYANEQTSSHSPS